MSSTVKNFASLETNLNVLLIILITDQQNYFSLYPAKILDLSAKPIFRCVL